MYYDQYFPFYAAHTHPMQLYGEQMQEREFARMKERYPQMASRIQEEAEYACEILDYEGSRLYDECPDRTMLREMVQGIRKKIKAESDEPSADAGKQDDRFLDELIEVLLYQEILRRRCRRNRCRYYWIP